MPRGRSLVAAMPRERVLTETDGPFCRIAGRPAIPADVELVERGLAGMWRVAAA
jgi:TatD DNase family protein